MKGGQKPAHRSPAGEARPAEIVPSAADIVVERRPNGCPAERHAIMARAMAALDGGR